MKDYPLPKKGTRSLFSCPMAYNLVPFKTLPSAVIKYSFRNTRKFLSPNTTRQTL